VVKGENMLGERKEAAAGLGQQDTASPPVKKRRAQCLLQGVDALTDGCLGQVQGTGSRRETA